MKVRNKLESLKIIKEKKLNSFPEKLFYKDQKTEIFQFLKDYPANYYAIYFVECTYKSFLFYCII